MNFSSQSQHKATSGNNEQLFRSTIDHHGKVTHDNRNSMSESEHTGLKRDAKRTTAILSKPSTAAEFLAKTPTQIRHEYRKLPNPPAKDTHAAR